MNNDDTSSDHNQQFPSASNKQHKNLRGAHDLDLIVTGKRQRKPSDKLSLAEKLKITFKPKNIGRRAMRLRPTASKKLNHIFGSKAEHTRIESHVNFDKIREEGFFENIHKKLKKGSELTDSETRETIIPSKTRRREFDDRNFSLNPLNSHSTRDYSERKMDIKRIKSLKSSKKNNSENEDLRSTPEPTRTSARCAERRNSTPASARKINARTLEHVSTKSPKRLLTKKQELQNMSKPRPKQNFSPLVKTMNQKRGQTGDKLQKPQTQDEEYPFSEAISKVAAIINFEKLPRELKKLMSMTDLKFIPQPSKDSAIKNGATDSKEETTNTPAKAGQKNSVVSQSPKKLMDMKGKVQPPAKEKIVEKSDQRLSKRSKDTESSPTKDSSDEQEVKNLEGNLFSRTRSGRSQKIFIKNKKAHLLVPEEQLGPMIKAAKKAKKNGQKNQPEQQEEPVIEDQPLDRQALIKTADSIAQFNEGYKNTRTYINCDLRYFNFDFLVDKLGHFDVILVDPPWRIRGAQQNDSSFMFSNSKFNLEYDTLSHQEIMNIRIDKLSRKGFIFLWIISNQMNAAYEILNRWGYDVVDQIIWVKMKDSKIYLSHGYYFMHSFEMCLVGYKCPPGEYVEYNSKISNNIIFGEVRKKSQKPDELYEIIELLMPGSKKIEIFARNHNLRPGWFSLGNQLGDLYDKWFNIVQCNECHEGIKLGVKRYKAKRQANYDVCEKCLDEKKLDIDNFFEFKNEVDEDVLHQYHSCNKCHSEPVWGTRFTCKDCENYDLCEGCFDANLLPESRFHDIEHEFKIFEIPVLADGLPAHPDKKCYGCFQKPIVGTCFSCNECPSLHFCQNCFFTKPIDTIKKFRGHQAFHRFEIMVNPDFGHVDSYKCQWCEISPIEGSVYKCDHCFNFYFCEKCYLKRQSYRPNIATSHKLYHNFTRLNAN